MAKLGTHKRPAVVRVRSTEEAAEIVGLAQEHGWKVIVGVGPIQSTTSPILPPKISGNDDCPCHSGKKFNKCCGAALANPGA